MFSVQIDNWFPGEIDPRGVKKAHESKSRVTLKDF